MLFLPLVSCFYEAKEDSWRASHAGEDQEGHDSGRSILKCTAHAYKPREGAFAFGAAWHKFGLQTGTLGAEAEPPRIVRGRIFDVKVMGQ